MTLSITFHGVVEIIAPIILICILGVFIDQALKYFEERSEKRDKN